MSHTKKDCRKYDNGGDCTDLQLLLYKRILAAINPFHLVHSTNDPSYSDATYAHKKFQIEKTFQGSLFDKICFQNYAE